MPITVGSGVTVSGGMVFTTGNLAEPWTLVSSPTQVSVTTNFSITGGESLPNNYSDVKVSPDGLKLSVLNDSASISMYNLSAANTLGALPSAYDTASISFSVAHAWKPDGSELVVLWWFLGRLLAYDTSAWFPSTISNANVYTGGWSSQFSSQITGLYVSDDGTKVFVAGDASVAYYTMTAWTPSTLSFQNSFAVPGASSVRKVFFKSDGTRMFVCVIASGVTQIRQYNLSSAWTMSTAILASTFVTTDFGNAGQAGLAFTSDGQYMYTGAYASNSAVRIWNTNA